MERHEFVLGHINHPTISQSTTRTLAVWLIGNALIWINVVNLATSGPVITGMGGCPGSIHSEGHLPWYVA